MLDTRMVSLATVALAALTVAVHNDVAAQSGIASYGITGATFDFHGGPQEQALGAIVQLTPAPWLVLGAIPTVLRVAGSQEGTARTGLGDLPVYAGVVHGFALPWRPTLGVTGVASLPTGNASEGLGRGQSVMSANGTLAVSPVSMITLRAGASRVLWMGDSLPHGVATTAVFGDAVLLAGSRTNLGVGYAQELRGAAPPAYTPARVIDFTVVHTLAGRASLIMSAGHTLAGFGPSWSFALGFGTAFAGLSPVGATSPSARSGGGLTQPGGAGMLPIGSAACRLDLGC